MASVVVVGVAGRMGSLVKAAVDAADGLEFAAGYDVANIEELDESAPAADLVIDFSQPAALPHVAAYVRRTGASLVSGTTGFSGEDLACLRSLGDSARVVWSSNYSLGVAVLRRVATQAARALEGWECEIVETHHKMKLDAPSGTAKTIAEQVGEVTGREVPAHSMRGGTVAGTHEVHFFGTDEEITLTHRAASRQIFVAGAVACGKRLLDAEVGFHTFDELMFDESR